MLNVDPDALDRLWVQGTAPLSELPAAVVAPVLGTAWYGVYGRAPALLHLEGSAGSGKTSLARLGCQYSSPDLSPTQMAGAVWGAPVIGSTWTGVLRAVDRAPRGLFLIDDVVAGTGERKSKARIDDLVTYVSSGASRIDAGRIVPPPSASIVTTSIYGPSTRVADLAYRIDVNLDSVHLRAMASLETETSRAARGSIGSALEDWISEAEDLERIEQSFNEYLSGTLPEGIERRPHDPRLAAAFGIELMVMMLSDLGAVDSERCLEFKRWAREGIMSGVENALSSPIPVYDSSRLVSALREALVQSVEAELVSVRGLGERQEGVPLIGELRGDRLLLFPGPVRDILSAHSPNQYRSVSSIRVARALEKSGWISADADGKRASGRRVDGVKRRVWELPASFLDGPFT